MTAVCATPYIELVRKLGADRVIDYTAGDFTSDGPDYHVVFDAAGKSLFGRCRRLLRPGGIYMSTGPGPRYQNLILPLITSLRGKKVVSAVLPRTAPFAVATIGAVPGLWCLTGAALAPAAVPLATRAAAAMTPALRRARAGS